MLPYSAAATTRRTTLLLSVLAAIGRPLLNAAALALGLATAAAALARHWWVFDLFSHFRLQYVVLGATLFPVALVLRPPAAVVLGVVAATHAWAIKDLWLGGDEAVTGLPLRVASANVWDEENPTPEKLLEFAQAARPDLLLVVDAQSSRWREVLAGLGGLYPYRAPQDWREGAPVILFSRLPIVAAREKPMAGRAPRLVSEVEIGGRKLAIVGVHPSSPSPNGPRNSRLRNRQLDDIAAGLGRVDQPVIVLGDFNTTPWSPHFRDLVDETGLRNAADGQGWIGTWPSWFWPARIPIDHVLLRGPLGVASFRRGPFIGSDHFPVLADLRLRPD
jgi:endonuclease/exonuclease/phosphatase (EEP) superfamily protein YafD